MKCLLFEMNAKGIPCHAKRACVALVLGSLLLPASDAHAQEDRAARAAVLFQQGKQALDGGDFAEAAKKLAESQRLDPGVGTLLRLGRAYEGHGKIASAWAAYTEARELARRANDTDRKELADLRLADVSRRLMRIRLTVPPEARVEELRIARNGEIVGQAEWGEELPFDPDTYLVEASAPGRKRWSTSVRLDAEGVTVEVVVPVLDREEQPTSPASDSGAPATGSPPGTDDGAHVEQDRSHAWRPGATVRIDIDGQGRGVILSPGLSFGLGGHLEVGAGALIGRYSGFWAGLTAYVLEGAWKPLAFAGLDVFVVEGEGVPGLHGLLGLQWDPVPHFGAMAGLGLFYLPDTPAVFNHEDLYFVPSIGVQGRL